ncbi:hypothetical protein OF83DRAFT_1180599 [Amylostereum chailletii]|nr:hypothetical protein OF83DRAFT_1180599 [Amylostereum chailletii]
MQHPKAVPKQPPRKRQPANFPRSPPLNTTGLWRERNDVPKILKAHDHAGSCRPRPNQLRAMRQCWSLITQQVARTVLLQMQQTTNRSHWSTLPASVIVAAVMCFLHKLNMHTKSLSSGIQGELSHWAGSLLLSKGHAPRYAQLYIYDPRDALDYRMQRNHNLRHDTIHTLQTEHEAEDIATRITADPSACDPR